MILMKILFGANTKQQLPLVAPVLQIVVRLFTPRQGGVLLSVLSAEEGEGELKTTDRIGMKFCMRLCHHEGQLTTQDGTYHSNGCHGNDKKHCFLGHFSPFL